MPNHDDLVGLFCWWVEVPGLSLFALLVGIWVPLAVIRNMRHRAVQTSR